MFHFARIILILLIFVQSASNVVAIEAQNFDAVKPEIEQEIIEIIPQKPTIIYTVVPRGIILSVAQTELFNGTSSSISNCGKLLLEKIANLLKKFNNKCTIETHTEEFVTNDKVYSEDWEVSIIRANAIAKFMVDNFDIDSERIFPLGYGKIMPFRENVALKNFPDNRVDFVIFDYTFNR